MSSRVDGWAVSQGLRELIKRFDHRKERLTTELSVELLPRQRERILSLVWSDTPLVYNCPRFGALETRLSDRSRGGWQIALARNLQQVPEHILDWVLWREALLSFLLPHLRHIPEAADLGLYAGFLYGEFSDDQQETLKALWRQVSPPKHYQHYIYDAPFGFLLFNQVVAGTFLKRALPWLNTLRSTITGTPLATPTYTAALERWMLETHTPLTQPEHRILTALTQITTPLHQARLAKQLGMTVSGLSQHLTKLAQRHLLRLNHFINLPLIGLIPHELIIHTPNHKTRQHIAAIFGQICYTWLINPIKHASIHCRVFIPSNRQTEFHHWLNELTKKYNLLPISLARTSDIIQAWNLDSYIPEHGWPHDFTLLLHQVQAILDDQYENNLPLLSTSTMSYELLDNNKQYPVALRSEDFTYFLRAADIHQITDRITAQPSKELRQAGISETAHMVYRRRIKRLEKLNVSHVQGLFLMHIGLDAVLQIYVNEPRAMVEQVNKALSILPAIYGLIFDNGNGFVSLYVPKYCAVDTLSTLRKIFAKHEINAFIETKPTWQAFSGFESPVKLQNYDIEKREWKWEQTTLPDIGSEYFASLMK